MTKDEKSAGLPKWVIKMVLAKVLLLILAAGGAYLYFQSL